MVCKQAFPVDLKKTEIRDSFWSPKQQIILDTAIDYQEKILNDQIPGAEKSHAVANFRIAAGLEEGEFYGGQLGHPQFWPACKFRRQIGVKGVVI